MLASIGQDLKFCWRLYARKPGFAAIAVATLAVGIGSNVATFSLVRSLLLRPYPFADLERLVLLRETRQGDAAGFGRLAPADVIDLQADSTTFDAVMPYRFGELNLTGKGYPEQVRSFAIAADLFSVLQARPLHGRTFLPGEDRPGRDRVVILSHGLWQRRFAGSTGVLGQSVQLDGGAYTVIGIMPEDGTYPKGAEVWVPLALSTEDRTERVASSLAVLARIRSDKSIEQARAELASFSGRLARQYPQTNAGRSLDLIPLREEQYEYTLPFFSMLQAAAVLVLLLACANVANLLLTQRVARAREIAVREALGAGRGRLLRQFILESLVLALVAGALAVPVAHWAATLIRTTMPAGITIWVAGWSAIAVDRAVLGFALALTVLVGGLFGWISSLRRSQATLPAQLRVAGTGTLGHRRGWLRRLLVATETGLALILLSAALLLLQGFRQLSAVFSGLEARSVLILRLPLPEERYPEEARAAELFDRLVADLRALPGVQTVGVVRNLPASNVPNVETSFARQDRPPQSAGEMPSADLQTVGGDIFEVFRIPVLAGRAVSDRDGPESPGVAVVSRSLARRFFAAEDPVGRRIKLGPLEEPAPWLTIVGVVSDIKQNWFDPQPRPTIYVSYRQLPRRRLDLAARTGVDPAALMEPVRRLVRRLDPEQAIGNLKSLQEEIDESLAPLRIIGAVMSVFGAVALLLATVGVYSVLSSAVAQRAQEFGVRMALGAQQAQVRRQVLGEAARLTGFGLAVALPLIWALSSVLASRLYGIVTVKPALLLGLTILLLGLGLIAAYLPARRATRADPVQALRQG